MTKNKKALLLSIFVFPGAGQFLLRRYLLAGIFAGSSLIVCYTVISHIMMLTNSVIEGIKTGEIAADFIVLHEYISVQLYENHADSIYTSMSIFIIIWVVGIADTYRIGNTQKQKNEP